MPITRTATAKGLLVVEAGLAVLGISFHFALLGEYGDISHSPLQAWRWGFTTGVGGTALVLVAIPAVAAVLVAPRLRMRLVAGALPVLMVLGMLAVTPAALSQKLEQYDATPQCIFEDDMAGPGTRAARESQRAFESIEHVGYFGGGGGSGVGGCDRSFTLIEDVDALQHYRTALPGAGWQVVEEGADRLRAERDGMAFEVAVCGRGGVVWAGEVGIRGGARCDRESATGAPDHS
ncbi:MAG: hypothetical protein Q8Q02_16980 [Nocardioides sp.]|nr:hypothetical protein [Nocardioides sp.]